MRKKVMFLLPSVRGGGAERVMVNLLNTLDREKFDLSLALVSKVGPFLNDIPSDVKLHDLQALRVRNVFVPLIKLIWKTKPDVLVSTQGYLNIAVLLARFMMPRRLKIIVREGSIVSEKLPTIRFTGLWKTLYRTLYKRADRVVCQSNYMLKDLYDNFETPLNKLVQIYNPVNIGDINKRAGEGSNPFHDHPQSFNIVTVGRLSRVKRHDRMIESMPGLLKIKPNAKLWIVGTGELENELVMLRDRLHLQDYVFFAGFQNNPYIWMKNADLFLLTSDYEGLPNVVLEAVACNCSVIVTDHPGGTREIFELMEQEERIVQELEWKESWFVKPDETAMKLFTDTFSASVITRKYEKIFLEP